jgi:hypothetical protein
MSTALARLSELGVADSRRDLYGHFPELIDPP